MRSSTNPPWLLILEMLVAFEAGPLGKSFRLAVPSFIVIVPVGQGISETVLGEVKVQFVPSDLVTTTFKMYGDPYCTGDGEVLR